MPRPTAAQLSYGSVTVVFSTLAMLLLSRTSAGIGIAVIGTAAMALGLLVAVTVPAPLRAKTRKAARTATGVRTNPAVPTATSGASAEEVVVDDVHRTRIPAGRVGEHSLRR
ncbi:hypothetical protein LRD69_11190 [Streptomyces sp. JH14]|uniref:hypothetical protein n=1 Tax=Streptomyces sp. JH14 TaxID=2793630 RepID=UPI0023F7C2D0|nr:hypothetical protein [Streptomyces sp. JH14]MDF6042713.1 hypothetical protein [Streptomyces sp. JH14]